MVIVRRDIASVSSIGITLIFLGRFQLPPSQLESPVLNAGVYGLTSNSEESNPRMFTYTGSPHSTPSNPAGLSLKYTV